MKRLEQWSLVYDKGYAQLKGVLPDGKIVRTSEVLIVDVDDGTMVTESGTRYELGEPLPHYVEWCRENGHHIPTSEEPIKFIHQDDDEAG